MVRRALLSAAFLAGVLACVGDDPNPTTASPDGGTPGDGKPLGTRCGPGEACANGSCVDGYCCDKPCTGKCEACDLEGRIGQCTPVLGKPHHGNCEGDSAPSNVCAGSCDGKTVDACTFPETECSPGSCAGGTATLPSTCKAGTCSPQTTQPCALGCFADSCLGVTQLAAGYYFACAVLTDKKLRCWGDNANGQLGEGASDGPAVQKTPREVANLTNVVSFAASFGSACALLGDGTVKCWGSNGGGQLGSGTEDGVRHPTPALVPGITTATFLTGSSGGHFCAIVTGGQLRCWGSNDAGQVGNGLTGASSPVATVCAPDSPTGPGCTPATGATFVAAGDNHTCATFAGGQVACWGGNDYKQLGSNLANPQPLPKNIPNLTATYLTGGNRISCAASGGLAKCWGSVGAGRLGNGTEDISQVTPVSVCTKQDCSALLMNVTGVSTADQSVCALAGGAVSCWGDNSGGQLGDGNVATPKQNFAASSAIAAGAVRITSGGGTNYAIVVDRANRDVKCWGADDSSQCGDDPPAGTSFQKTPVSPKW